MRIHRRSIHLVLPLAAALLAACSPAPAPQPSAAAASATEAQAAKELALYRTLQQQQSWELAAPIGKEIVERFPDSAAAKEVAQTLDDTTSKATALSTQRRLERLWSYQSGKESGGEQNTASIYSSDVATGDRVRLVLRRHSEWGQSAYLFGSGKGFDCRGTCTLGVRFDEQPAQKLKAYLPPTGEAAIFISDDKGFIAKLSKAQKIRIDVREKGKAPRTLTFEVGGFDPEKFAVLARKK